MTETRRSGGPPRAVVVNDDPTQLNVMAGLLKKEGLRVAAFTDAEAALSAMDREGPPDLIVTDLYMPNLDGWRFCRLLRSPTHARLNQVPILVASATFSGDDAARITADLGADAFIPAPIDGRKFIVQVQSLLEGEKAADFLRCLIIEDDEVLSALLKNAFAGHGYSPEAVSTAEAARRAFSSTAYDVAIIDYHLPDDKGDGLLADFRRQRPECACIMITSDPHPQLALDWMKKGAAAFLRKSFDPEYLIDVCARVRRERALLRVEDLLEQRTRELRENEAKYRLLFTSMDSGLALSEILWDDKGGVRDYRILEVNPAFEAITGLSSETVVGRTGRDVLPDLATDWVDRCVQAAVSDGPLHLERYCSELGKHLSITAYCPLPGRLVAIFTDISQRKQAEANRLALERRLHQTRKAESLARMAGAIAHHFNNQLAAIMGNIELALEDLPKGKPLRKRLDSAMAAADRAVEVSRLMLACRGQIAGKKELRDLAKLCREVLPLAEPSLPENIRLKTEMPATGPLIRGDAAQLGQVLTHLIENAAEAIGEGPGEICIRVAAIESAGMEKARVFPVDWQPPAPRLACLTVADTGSGMDEAAVDQLFDPYFTTKFAGRGLGLAVALGTVTGHGGAVAVESRSGSGSAFKVLLPICAADVSPEPEDGPASGPAFQSGGTVLLVDDQESVRNVTEAMLERMGFSVLTARNGGEAVAGFSEHRDRIRCVISDLTMPGMDGWETLRALRAMRPDLPAILASGYDEAAAMAKDPAGLAPVFLYKPYQKTDLRKALRQALGRSE